MRKRILATAALAAAFAAAPVWAGSWNNMRGQGDTTTANGTPGHWSIGGGPMPYPSNGSSAGLVFHYTDKNIDMSCVFAGPDAAQTTGGNPTTLGFFPNACQTKAGVAVPQPAGSGFTFTASPANGPGTYTADAETINIRLADPVDTVVTFNGTAAVGPNP